MGNARILRGSITGVRIGGWLFITILLASCARSTNPAQVVEAYLQAIADRDADRLVTLSCKGWEASALLEYDALSQTQIGLRNVHCQSTGNLGTTVACTGSLLLHYGSEEDEIPLDDRLYQMERNGEDWVVCGMTRIPPTRIATPQQSATPIRTLTLTATAIHKATPTPITGTTRPPTVKPAPIPTRSAAEAWKTWPIIPIAPASIREIYQRGLALGNDPHAFSILGDCQSLPEVFLGVYADPAAAPPELRDVVEWFGGSFDRASPTVKDGTTSGAVVWSGWHTGEFGCGEAETPLDCELRLHHPSIIFINLGTHYETRNADYLRKIIERLLEAGVIPILTTKADNREGDERLNLETAYLAVEYGLPLWNFWAAVVDLPEGGLYTMKGREYQGPIYLTEEAQSRHRLTALQVLDAIWRTVW